MKVLTLILCILCLAYGFGSNAAVMWQTGFESPDYSAGELVPQNSWEYFTTYISGNDVTNVNPFAGSQCVRLYNNGAGDASYSMVRHAVDVSSADITNSYIRFSTMIWPNSKYDGFRIYDTSWSQQILLAVRDTGVSLGGVNLYATYTNWNEISLTFDVLNQQVIEFSVNDDIASINVSAPFIPSGVRLSTQFAAPWPEGLGYTNAFFDNVKVETTPSFRITPSSTSLEFTTLQPQVLTLTPDLSGLSYDVTVSSSVSWITSEPSTFIITDSPVVVTVAVQAAGLTLPTSAPLDVVSSEGALKRLTVNVRSSLIAYDGYNYPLGDIITNLNGGTGWDSPWFVRAGTGFTAENIIVDGLTYSKSNITLQTEGNAAYLIPVENGGFNYSRVLTTSIAGDKKTVWISMLIQPKLTAWATCDLFFNPNWGGDQGAFGCQWNPNFRFVNGATTTVPGTLDETFFVVVRYDLDGANDVAYMWINPELQSEAKAVDADAVNIKDMPLGTAVDWIINHNHGGTQRGAIIFDELRIGDTWADVVPTDVPGGVRASAGDFEDKVQVIWNPLTGASSYTVYRASTNDSSVAAILQSGITTNVYDDTTAVPLQIYWYWVKSDLSVEFSGSDSGYRAEPGIPQPPENVTASDGTYTDKIVVTWDLSANADRYRVLRNTKNNASTATNISGQISTNFYEDTSVVQGAAYYYWVEAGSASGWSFPSDPDSGSTPYDAVAYEGFDYTSGENLNGTEGGLGWSDPWVGTASTVKKIQPPGFRIRACRRPAAV